MMVTGPKTVHDATCASAENACASLTFAYGEPEFVINGTHAYASFQQPQSRTHIAFVIAVLLIIIIGCALARR